MANYNCDYSKEDKELQYLVHLINILLFLWKFVMTFFLVLRTDAQYVHDLMISNISSKACLTSLRAEM